MEVSALRHPGLPLRGPTPLLRLQSDERLVALTRRGSQAAFESLVARYQARLLAFCRHMLGSREDAEDVLQEVFAAAFNAMVADERPINVRPWLYRIARNRSLNHLRRQQAIGVDSMDVHLAENGTTTADKVHRREEFRQLMGDVQELAETQRTALLLREIDALSYEQIAEAMETTVPSVKSLLVRARVSLAEAAEARKLTCEEVRLELGEVAEGLKRTSAPVRRHVRSCERCATFRKQLKATNRALAAVFPVGPLLIVKKLFLAHLGTTASAGGATAAAAGTASVGAGSALSAGAGAIASKTAAGLAAAALVTAGAVEVDHATRHRVRPHPAVAQAAVAPAQPVAVAQQAQVVTQPVVATPARVAVKKKAKPNAETKPEKVEPLATTTTPAAPADATTPAPAPAPTTQEESDTTVLPPQDTGHGAPVGPSEPVESVPPADQQQAAQPAPAPQPAADQQQAPPQDQQQQAPPSGDPSAGEDQYQGNG
ncbi:MAG TPA: RNA polymerase sigma factor [Solirubrobacteraceae bacterium]